MLAVQIGSFGGPAELKPIRVPDPRPGPGQILIAVAFSEVLYLDVQLRSGWGGDFFPIELPFVLGVGVSGKVTDTGNGVDPGWRGRRVIAGLGDNGGYVGGGYAEQAVAPVSGAHAVPEGLALDVAAAAISDGVMGVSRLEYAELRPGDTVIVSAAAGGIASWVIPEARDRGVRVIALARGRRKGATALERGADVVIDHGDPDWLHRLRTALRDSTPAAVFDGNGGQIGQVLWSLAGPGTRFFSYGSGGGTLTDTSDADLRGIHVWSLADTISQHDRHRWTETALAWLDEQRVVPIIGQRVPLHLANEAHAAIEARTVVGKTLLVTD